MIRATISLIVVVTCCSGWLQAADVAMLTDGDRLTGTIQKLEKGKLFFKSKYSKTPLQIDWTLVSGLTSESQIKMTLRDGTEETGKFLAPATSIQLSKIVALEPKAMKKVKMPPAGSGGRGRTAP